MAKQPKLVLRESCIHDVSGSWLPGRFLEMGAGTGHMTRLFLDRGFHGTCYDLGDDSRQMIRSNLADYHDRIDVPDDADILERGAFDYLFAFEVLEHIQDDSEAFTTDWVAHLKPGGTALVSVPAHTRKYGRSDELVGHVRRYEKRQQRTCWRPPGSGRWRSSAPAFRSPD